MLRELLGEPKKINGTMTWRIPYRNDGSVHVDIKIDDGDL